MFSPMGRRVELAASPFLPEADIDHRPDPPVMVAVPNSPNWLLSAGRRMRGSR